MKRRGVSGVVVTILMVLLALGAVLLVWGFVRNIISEAGEEIDITQFTTSFTLPGKSAKVNAITGEVSVVVQRGAGPGIVKGF